MRSVSCCIVTSGKAHNWEPTANTVVDASAAVVPRAVCLRVVAVGGGVGGGGGGAGGAGGGAGGAGGGGGAVVDVSDDTVVCYDDGAVVGFQYGVESKGLVVAAVNVSDNSADDEN